MFSNANKGTLTLCYHKTLNLEIIGHNETSIEYYWNKTFFFVDCSKLFAHSLILSDIKVQAFFKENVENTCAVLMRVIITFANQIFL